MDRLEDHDGRHEAGESDHHRGDDEQGRRAEPGAGHGTIRWTGLPLIFTVQVVTSLEVPLPFIV